VNNPDAWRNNDARFLFVEFDMSFRLFLAQLRKADEPMQDFSYIQENLLATTYVVNSLRPTEGKGSSTTKNKVLIGSTGGLIHL
jgi:hypothetical protein